MRRHTAVAWGVLAFLLVGSFVILPIFKGVMTERSASAPLSRVIVAAITTSPKGFTNVSDELCAAANEDSLASAVSELWLLDATLVTAEGISSASFTKPNGFFEGVQKLWFEIDDETDYCFAKVQTYSW